jgi:hypothetical protein
MKVSCQDESKPRELTSVDLGIARVTNRCLQSVEAADPSLAKVKNFLGEINLLVSGQFQQRSFHLRLCFLLHVFLAHSHRWIHLELWDSPLSARASDQYHVGLSIGRDMRERRGYSPDLPPRLELQNCTVQPAS